ncbi:MAG: GH36 C-terminal domain-containing protein [Chloroflexi bacterium]|nr:GH36 C-terminal domain-containing protein [Chloroflexota bacterium]
MLADGREAVYSAVIHTHQVGSFRPNPPLKGLQTRANYAVYDRRDNEIYRATGYELMTLGMPRGASEFVGHSQTLHIKQVHHV